MKFHKIKLAGIALLFLIIHVCCQKTNKGNEDSKLFLPADKIESKIFKGHNITIKDTTIKNTLNFTTIGERFPENPNKYRNSIPVSITFVNCTFHDDLLAFSKDNNAITSSVFENNITFINCSFKGKVNFSESLFKGVVNFSASEFEDIVDFQGATFLMNKSYFSECIFKNSARFQRTDFYGDANFFKCDFDKDVSFQNALVRKDLNMASSTFQKYADFINVSIYRDVNFNYTKFMGRVILQQLSVYGNFSAEQLHFHKNADLSYGFFGHGFNTNDAFINDTLFLNGSVFVAGNPSFKTIKLHENAKIIKDF